MSDFRDENIVENCIPKLKYVLSDKLYVLKTAKRFGQISMPQTFPIMRNR